MNQLQNTNGVNSLSLDIQKRDENVETLRIKVIDYNIDNHFFGKDVKYFSDIIWSSEKVAQEYLKNQNAKRDELKSRCEELKKELEKTPTFLCSLTKEKLPKVKAAFYWDDGKNVKELKLND